ncbi:MAG: TonB-dependent receptor [Sphingomonadales bacterium]|nr:MAG: TonB-dependent receptor [Sphingomonadales bacterium]
MPTGSPFRTFPPEKLSDVEFGIKSQFSLGDVQVRANLAAYRGIYENIQRTTFETIGNIALNVTRSAAKGRIQGLEFNGTIVPVRGLSLNGSYSYIDAEYTEVVDSSAAAILAGSPFPYTPKHKYSVGAAYETDLGNAGSFFLNANYAHQSSVSTAQTNASFYRFLPAYGQLNASIGLRDIGGRPIDISLFGTNLTDTARPVGVLDQYNAGPGFVGLTYTEPRMYGVRLGYRFGN